MASRGLCREKPPPICCSTGAKAIPLGSPWTSSFSEGNELPFLRVVPALHQYFLCLWIPAKIVHGWGFRRAEIRPAKTARPSKVWVPIHHLVGLPPPTSIGPALFV